MQDTYYQPSNWCKFDALDNPSFIIVSCMVLPQFILFYFFLRSLIIRVRNHIIISNQQKMIYKIMVIWFISTYLLSTTAVLLKSMINIIVYLIFSKEDQKQNYEPQIVLSSIGFFLQKMRSFTLHTILLTIPCIWIKNIMLKTEGKQLDLKIMKQIDWVFGILRCCNFYIKFRLIIVLINLAFLIYMNINPNFGQNSKYLTLISMIQAGIVIILYTYGLWSFSKFQKILNFSHQLQTKIVLQYSLLMICCIARLIFDVTYYFILDSNKYSNTNTNCFDLKKNHYIITQYIYLSLGFVTMHLLPIATIILIYWPEISKKDIDSLALSISSDNDMDKKEVFFSSNNKEQKN